MPWSPNIVLEEKIASGDMTYECSCNIIYVIGADASEIASLYMI